MWGLERAGDADDDIDGGQRRTVADEFSATAAWV